MKTTFQENKMLIATYPFVIPTEYPSKAPKNISKKFHEGCEVIRRGRIKEGLYILHKEGAKYHPLTAYVVAQLSAYFEKDWNRVMDLLLYAMINEDYYKLIIAHWLNEKLFDFLLVNTAALKTGRTEEADKLFKVLDIRKNIAVEYQKENVCYKDKLLQPHEYLNTNRRTWEADKLYDNFEKAITKEYYRQDYLSMAYGFVKLKDSDKAAQSIIGWNEFRTCFINSKSVIVIPLEALIFHEYYNIGNDEFMEKQWNIQQKSRYVRLPEDGPADTRLPKSKPCNNLKSFKVSGLMEAAFGDKLCVCEGWIFEKQLLGNIEISTGKIIADDPLMILNKEFITDFPKGSFPVEIAIAGKSGDQRVALARLKFSEMEVNNWEIALTSRLKPKKGELYGYAVDTGTGSFADVENYKIYEQQSNEETNDFIIKEFERNNNTGFIYKNVAMFSTGFGDGLYQSYIGRDVNGNIVNLVTDFRIINS